MMTRPNRLFNALSMIALAVSAGSLPAVAQTAAAPATGTPPINTLTQALSVAYYNNATLQEQRAALRQADENVPAAISGWRPTVTLTGSAGRVVGTETQLIGGSDFTENLNQNRNEAIGQATLTQPIYSGGKTLNATRQAKNQVYAQRAQLLAAEQQVFLNVVTDYVTVITDTHLLALDQNNVEVLRRQLQATTDQFNIGDITLTSVAQAKAALAQAKAQVAIAVGNLQIAKENFRHDVGQYPAELTPPQPLDLPVISQDDAGAQAERNNPNVIAAEFSNAADKDAIDVAFSALLPQVSIQASGYLESNPNGPQSRESGGSILGQLTVPLYQGGQEYAGIRQARAKAQQSFASIIDARRSGYAQATQAWEGLSASRAAVVSTNTEIKANAIALDGTEREEIVGTRDTLDVLNAQQLLLQSQDQQVQNIGNLVTESYTVAAAIGRLTATDLGLPIDQYDDLKYYDAVEYAGFGTGEAADAGAGISPDGSLLNSAEPAGLPLADQPGAQQP
jgi:outer membrane protein